MGLLNRGTENVTVYPEETTTSPDGNIKTKPSATGVVARAVVQPLSTTEDDSVGYLTTSKCRLRLVGWQGGLLGAQAQVEWQGNRYAVEGEPMQYRGSRRTAHVDYVMVRR